MSTIELEDANREETAESIAELRATVEDRGAEGILLAIVEQRQKVEGTGEEDSFDLNMNEFVVEGMGERRLTNPMKKRVIRRPVKLWTEPMVAETTPHKAMAEQMYAPGYLIFDSIMLEGTCIRMYPTNRMLTQV